MRPNCFTPSRVVRHLPHKRCHAHEVTRKQHHKEHRPQRPSESIDTTQHAKGRPGDCPGPCKERATRQNVTRRGRGRGGRGALGGRPGRTGGRPGHSTVRGQCVAHKMTPDRSVLRAHSVFNAPVCPGLPLASPRCPPDCSGWPLIPRDTCFFLQHSMEILAQPTQGPPEGSSRPWIVPFGRDLWATSSPNVGTPRWQGVMSPF